MLIEIFFCKIIFPESNLDEKYISPHTIQDEGYKIVGDGLSGDAHHVTAPAMDGAGATRAMKMAIKRAGINLEDVEYVNAHGTSTPLGDEIELGAGKRLFGDHSYSLSMSSTKSARNNCQQKKP